MADYTSNLDLLKKDPIKDGNDYFDIATMLNDNWDKIDLVVGGFQDKLDEHDFSIDILQRGLQRLMIEMELDGKIEGGTAFFHDFKGSPKNIKVKDSVYILSKDVTTGGGKIPTVLLKGSKYKEGDFLTIFDDNSTEVIQIKTSPIDGFLQLPKLTKSYKRGALVVGSSLNLAYEKFEMKGEVL